MDGVFVGWKYCASWVKEAAKKNVQQLREKKTNRHESIFALHLTWVPLEPLASNLVRLVYFVEGVEPTLLGERVQI